MTQYRLLLVDDHEVVRLGLKSLLERHPGFAIIGEAAAADEAVEKAKQLKPDIVLMDIRIIGGNGIDACRQIRTALPDTKVIMLTSYADEEMLLGAIRAGAQGYALKQLGGNALVKEILRVAQGEVYLDPSMTKFVFTEIRQEIEKKEQTAFTGLTPQELKMLSLIVDGHTNRSIAEIMFLSEGTVRNYVSSILSKLGVANRTEAASYAMQHHLRDYLS